jgi:hypothetical protein
VNKSPSLLVQLIVFAAHKARFKTLVVGHRVHTVAELQQQIHDDLRKQHPEWIEPDGNSPMCDFYEARLSRLLGTCARPGSAKAA